MQPIGHSLVVTAVVVATTVTVATTGDEDDSDSDENLRQALLLVEILKSAILRRSQRRFAAKPSSLADYADYRPWPPPYGTQSNGYGLPFRRMNNQDDDAGRRKDNNITRQMDYEDPYGPHPGGDDPSTPGEATEGSTSPQENVQNKDTIAVTTKITETTAAETKLKSTSISPLDNKAKITKVAMKKTIGTEKTTQREKLSGTPKKSGATSIQSSTKRKIKKPTITKSRKTNRENFQTTTKFTAANVGGIIMLKYNKNSKDRDVIDNKRADEAEMAEAAMELQREAGDIVQRRCAARRTHSGPGRTGPSESEAETSCVGPHCNEGNATQVTTLRYKATTRIYLSRSVRPQIPLPANNAFCYTNPENALCRTMI